MKQTNKADFTLTEFLDNEHEAGYNIRALFTNLLETYFKLNPDVKEVSHKRLVAWLEECAKPDTNSKTYKDTVYWYTCAGNIGLAIKNRK